MELEKHIGVNQLIGIDKPIPVSEYLGILNEGLREYYASIIGEVGQVSKSSRGHVYFSLKDHKKESVIYCVIWKSNFQMFGIDLVDGMEIVATGYPDIYEPTGRLTFKADTIELVGEGVLKKAYEELKLKLTGEGIFDVAKKRPIPEYPHKIGVITSIHGAVIHDFINNLGRYGFHVKIMDSRVEGQQAVRELLLSMRSFRKEDTDVLVMIRGGGSLESLMPFNNEALVREVSNYPVPVIAGIGHHLDVPLVSLAADAMESTPTATANLLNKSWDRAEHMVQRYQREIFKTYSHTLSETRFALGQSTNSIQAGLNTLINYYKEIEYTLKSNISKVAFTIQIKRRAMGEIARAVKRQFRRRVKGVEENIGRYWFNSLEPCFADHLLNVRKKIDIFDNIIRLNDPVRQLRLGYSITRISGKVVRSVGDVEIGDLLDIQVADGEIESQVKGKDKNEQKG